MFFFNLKFLKQTKVRILLWINFISCILKYKNSKKILLYSQLGWHLGSQQNLRKKVYTNWIKKKKFYHVIDVNFEDKLMLKVLLFFLTKIYPKDKIPIKELKNNKIPKEIFDIKNSAISTMWDIKLRDLHTDNKIICLPTNLQNYKEMFKNFSKKFNFDKKKYKLLLKVCLFKNIEFIFTEDSYEEWICASVFYKYKKKIFYFEHIYGFLEIDYENDLTFNQKIDRFFLNFASKIENKYLQIAEANLTQRVKGIYNSASLFHTKRKNLEKRNYYRFNQIRNNALFLFNHAFADASNKRVFNRYSFTSYYEMALHVIDFASKKNLPLYIKPHPTRYTYTSEQKFNSSIAKSLDEKKRANPNFYFELINGELNNCDLLKFKNLIAITGRGTVSIECGFLGIPIITMYDSFNNFSFTTNFSNYKSLDLAIEKINDNYNKKNSRIDAIKVEAVLEKINRERLIEFTNISKETGRIKILNNTIFENSFKI